MFNKQKPQSRNRVEESRDFTPSIKGLIELIWKNVKLDVIADLSFKLRSQESALKNVSHKYEQQRLSQVHSIYKHQ